MDDFETSFEALVESLAPVSQVHDESLQRIRNGTDFVSSVQTLVVGLEGMLCENMIRSIPSPL